MIMKKIVMVGILVVTAAMLAILPTNMDIKVGAQFHPPGGEPEPCYAECNPCPCPPHENGHSEYGYSTEESYFHSPKVEFPTQQQIFDYLTEYGIKKEFTVIANNTQTSPQEINAAIAKDDLWVAWIESANNSTGNKNNTLNDKVLITVSRDNGEEYETPIQLSPESADNISDLQLITSDSGRFVDLIWLDGSNSTNTLFISVSSNYGQDFKTYPLTLSNFVNASNPVFKANGENILLVWKETISHNGTNVDVMYSHSRHW
jgi:hypothetical protein